MNYMYILECADRSFYTGSTKHLERRIWEHQNGLGANHTKKRLPVKLVYCEPYERIDDAFRREKQVQGWSRRKKQALIENNQENLIEFSKNYTQYGRPEQRLPSTSSGLASTGSASTGSASTGSASTGSASTGSAFSERIPLPELVEGNTDDESMDARIRENLEGLRYEG